MVLLNFMKFGLRSNAKEEHADEKEEFELKHSLDTVNRDGRQLDSLLGVSFENSDISRTEWIKYLRGRA